jgi:hypothetical protein
LKVSKRGIEEQQARNDRCFVILMQDDLKYDGSSMHFAVDEPMCPALHWDRLFQDGRVPHRS